MFGTDCVSNLQNIRGGRVKLTGIVSPEMEFNHPEKGDALHAMELALSLEVILVEYWFCRKRRAARMSILPHADSNFVGSWPAFSPISLALRANGIACPKNAYC